MLQGNDYRWLEYVVISNMYYQIFGTNVTCDNLKGKKYS